MKLYHGNMQQNSHKIFTTSFNPSDSMKRCVYTEKPTKYIAKIQRHWQKKAEGLLCSALLAQQSTGHSEQQSSSHSALQRAVHSQRSRAYRVQHNMAQCTLSAAEQTLKSTRLARRSRGGSAVPAASPLRWPVAAAVQRDGGSVDWWRR